MPGFDLPSFQKTVGDIKNSHMPFRSPGVDMLSIGVIISICSEGGYLQTRWERVFVAGHKAAYSAWPPKLLYRHRDPPRTRHYSRRDAIKHVGCYFFYTNRAALWRMAESNI